MKIVYERKKAIAQSRDKWDLYERYVARERSRERDFKNKLSAGLRDYYQTLYMFSRILIRRILCLGRGLRRVGRGMLEHHGGGFIRRMSEAVLAAYVDPRNVSRECPRCGFVVETREGQVFEYPRCDLKMGRQKVS